MTSNMPKLKLIVVQMRVSAEDGARIAEAAKRDNRTVSAWLRHISRQALETEKAESIRRLPNRLQKARKQQKGQARRP